MSAVRFLVLLAATGVVVAVAYAVVGKRDTPARAVILATAVMLLYGQVANDERRLYPLVSWRMYTTADAPRYYYQFSVVTATGGRTDYPTSLIAPFSPGPLRGYSMLAPLTFGLVRRQALCRCDKDDVELDALLEAMIDIYQRHRAERVLRFVIEQRRAHLAGAGSALRPIYSWSPRTPAQN
jgi:hypothetical protein